MDRELRGPIMKFDAREVFVLTSGLALIGVYLTFHEAQGAEEDVRLRLGLPNLAITPTKVGETRQ